MNKVSKLNKVSKQDVLSIVENYKNRFIDFKEQKETTPSYVYNDYIRWLYQSWEDGMINIHEYRKAININILEQ